MPKFDWENLVGVKLFSWIAGVALLLAAVFFLRYSINQGWLMPPVRMAIGIVVGVGLLILCELKAARKYPVTANAMDASAIAILFSTFFAARVLWDLIIPVAAFGLMVLVTAVAVLLSIRRDSIFIALLGLVGGFATPALLSTGENRPISLFTYILLLNAGLAWVAIKKKWPLLTLLSFVFTIFYQWGWVMKFLTASQLPIALGIFLIFPALAFAAFTLGQRDETRESWISLYGQTGNLSALLPLLFALYMAAVPGYGHSFGLLFGFLFLLDAGLFAIAIARGPEMLHLAGGLSTILIWAIWLSSSYEGRAWPSILGFVVLFALYYLAAPFIARRFGRDFAGSGKPAVYTAPLLLFVMPCLATMEPACAAPWILFGALFLILFAVSAYAIYAKEGAIYYHRGCFRASDGNGMVHQASDARAPVLRSRPIRNLRAVLHRRANGGAASEQTTAPREGRRGTFAGQPGSPVLSCRRPDRFGFHLGSGPASAHSQRGTILAGIHVQTSNPRSCRNDSFLDYSGRIMGQHLIGGYPDPGTGRNGGFCAARACREYLAAKTSRRCRRILFRRTASFSDSPAMFSWWLSQRSNLCAFLRGRCLEFCWCWIWRLEPPRCICAGTAFIGRPWWHPVSF